MKKKIIIGVLISIASIAVIAFLGFKIHDWYIWRAPYYNSTQKQTLLSSKVDKLSDQQEAEFWSLSHDVLESELKIEDFSNFTDKSIFVEKTSKKHEYYVEYTCEMTIPISGIKKEFTTHFYITPKTTSFKKDSFKFTYHGFKSDLTDFMNFITSDYDDEDDSDYDY